MLYQVVMDEVYNVSPPSNFEVAFIAICLLFGIVSAIFGKKSTTTAAMIFGIATLAFYILFRAPWIVIQWGLARTDLLGNIELYGGISWITASVVYILRVSRAIAKDFRKHRPEEEKTLFSPKLAKRK